MPICDKCNHKAICGFQDDVTLSCNHFQKEVVRCKDCKHWQDGYFGYCTKIHSAMEYDAFCSNGERKDNEKETT